MNLGVFLFMSLGFGVVLSSKQQGGGFEISLFHRLMLHIVPVVAV
jgi:hypothetical protein